MTEIVHYFIAKLNITINNTFILDDIRNDLIKVDIRNFKSYFNENYINSKYDFKSGIAKFDLIMRDYSRHKNNEILENIDISGLSEKLYQKTCNIFEEISWHTQTKGTDLKNANLSKVFTLKEMKWLSKVGNRNELMHLVKTNKNLLRTKIAKELEYKTINSKNQLSSPFKDKEVLTKLKGG
tara:strand:+ start:55 stop:600 length:546 start_codon:yes stop_codon:yes gene_type:complete